MVIDKCLPFAGLHFKEGAGDMPDIGLPTQAGNRPIEVEGARLRRARHSCR
jgi:hypothetical protein